MSEQREPEEKTPPSRRPEAEASADPEQETSTGGATAPDGTPSELPPPEEFEALDEEEAIVEEAAERPATGASRAREERDRSQSLFLYAAMALGVLLVFGWIGATTLWQMRRDLSGLGSQMEALRAETLRTETVRSRATLYRIQADLEALRETLPADLGEEVQEAQTILGQISERLSSNP